MCGITGIFSLKSAENTMIKDIKLMMNMLRHRGPDFSNYYYEKENNIIFGHTRLSIIDLSLNANQPMISSNGNLVLTYNGEIYNFNEIKKLLNSNFNIIWKSNSDTEVLLNSIIFYGLDKTLELIEGMFAFSIYDKKENKIILVRDRFGQKPIFYYYDKFNFAFSSEIKPLFKLSFFRKEIDLNSIYDFLNLSYIPAPKTIYKNCFKLEPGSILNIDFSSKLNQININKKKWWNKDSIKTNIENINLPLEKASKLLEEKLYKSVGQQMVSDVPIGSFLSGGIDSSLISIFMQNLSNKKIDTFSVSFENHDYDESQFSSYLSNIIRSDHHELKIDNLNFLKTIEEIIDVYGEPFADSSQIPMILLSKFTSKKVRVCLSGDGADEVFGGYNRYKYIPMCWKIFKLLGLKNTSNNLVFRFFLKNFNFIFTFFYKFLSSKEDKQLKLKFEKLLKIIQNVKNEEDLYTNLISNEINSDNYTLDLQNLSKENKSKSILEKMIDLDVSYYLPNDILFKVDHAAMYSSLETRMPFLDLDLFKFSCQLPMKYKINKNNTKIILKHLLKKYTNEKFVNREKMGFSVPLNEWLHGPLKKTIEECKQSLSTNKYDFLNSLNINKKIDDYYSGKNNSHKFIWNVIILFFWLKKNN